MSIVVMNPVVTSWPCVLETERPSCEWRVDREDRARGRCAGALYAIVRAVAETDSLAALREIEPVRAGDAGALRVVILASHQPICCMRTTGAGSAAAGVAEVDRRERSCVHATWLPSAEITGIGDRSRRGGR